MDKKISLKNYISNRFEEFRKLGNFIDCVLVYGDERICCHRHVLARYSGWFKNYFEEHNDEFFGDGNGIKQNYVQEILIPLNPNNVMKQIVDFLYKGHIHFTTELIVSYLYCADFYKISTLEKIAQYQFNELKNVSHETTLFFAKRLIDYNLTSMYLQLAPIIATQLSNILKKQPTKLVKNDIFKSLNPKLFRKVLEEPAVKDLSDYAKAQLIDEYVCEDMKLTEEDKEDLASTINWDDKASYKILVSFDCDWVPSKISRNLYKQILDVRRHNIDILDKTTQQINNNSKDDHLFVNRWFLFPWIHVIRYSKKCDSNPKINIVDFISRLGFLNHKIDAVGYGLFSTSSSKPISSNYQSKYAFSDQDYFLTALADELPYIAVDFGKHSRVSGTKLKLRCHNKTEKGIERPYPNPFCVIGTLGNQETLHASSIEYKNLQDDKKYKLLDINPEIPFQTLKVAQESSTEAGFNVLRVLDFEIVGRFLP